MGRIHILSDQVANQIAAGEVVERPASVVKELLENSIDAGASHVRVDIEAGGRKLVRVEDDGCGMVRDDAMLAFERHATSKVRSSDDLLGLSTLGFRGEALPSIASVARVHLATRSAESPVGVEMEIAGGKIQRIADHGMTPGTILTVRDLFFNTPARRKFLKSEQTELSHVAALVTHYALAHPEMHFELHSASHALLEAPPVRGISERTYQIFGREVLEQLAPVAAETSFARSGIPNPPPWRRAEDWRPPVPGALRLHGLISRPELQKLNRNSIYIFVNRRLVRDRIIQHAITEAYRNIIPPTSFPVVLLFLEMPPEEVDVNVHPAKTEVRFRQQGFVHDFVRDGLRNAMIKTRPAASFLTALETAPNLTPALVPNVSPMPGPPGPSVAAGAMQGDSDGAPTREDAEAFSLTAPALTPQEQSFAFPGPRNEVSSCGTAQEDGTENNVQGTSFSAEQAAVAKGAEQAAMESASASLNSLAGLRPLGQLRASFILAVNEEGLWIIDQHVAHERVLFERVLRERQVERVQRQRLLMPVLVELRPEQMPLFATIAEELGRNGFEAEPFGPRTLAIKAAPVGLEGREMERMLQEVLEQTEHEQQTQNLETLRTRIAASIACHAAIKVNTPLDTAKMEWLLAELAKTEHPTSCPHGRPIALRYSMKEIQRAFQRI